MPKCCLMLPKLTAPDPKQLAEELIAAAGLCQPVPPFSLRYESFTATKAAAVRQAWLDLKAASGCRAAGKKIGKISFGWNGHTQVLRPGWGHILDSTLLVDGTALPCSHLIQPSVAAEFALLLTRDLAGPASPPRTLWPRLKACAPRSKSWTAGSSPRRSLRRTPLPTTAPTPTP